MRSEIEGWKTSSGVHQCRAAIEESIWDAMSPFPPCARQLISITSKNPQKQADIQTETENMENPSKALGFKAKMV